MDLMKYPDELEDITGFSVLHNCLIKRGFSMEEIKKIFGENLVSVYKKILR